MVQSPKTGPKLVIKSSKKGSKKSQASYELSEKLPNQLQIEQI